MSCNHFSLFICSISYYAVSSPFDTIPANLKCSFIDAGTQTYHVIIRTDAKHLPEVAEGHWGISLKSEVSIVVSGRQIAALTFRQKQRISPSIRIIIIAEQQRNKAWNYLYQLHFSIKLFDKVTWGKRYFLLLQSPAAAHLFQVSDLNCPPCVWCPAGWHLSEQRMLSATHQREYHHNWCLIFHLSSCAPQADHWK